MSEKPCEFECLECGARVQGLKLPLGQFSRNDKLPVVFNRISDDFAPIVTTHCDTCAKQADHNAVIKTISMEAMQKLQAQSDAERNN